MTTFLRTEPPFDPPQEPELVKAASPKPARITSIDAARGFIMLTMIFVNDLAGAPASANVPTWMQHASDVYGEMKRHGVSPLPAQDWLTFVDLVFPGFLFIVGMSIPFAIGNRLNKGEQWWKILPHVLFRTFALLMLGVLMASGRPDGTKMPWYSPPVVMVSAAPTPSPTAATITSRVSQSIPNTPAAKQAAIEQEKEKLAAAKEKAGNLWIVFWYTAAFLAFCQLSPFWVKKDDLEAQKRWKWTSLTIRVLGAAALLYLILLWEKTGVDRKTHIETTRHLLTFSPFGFQYRNADILGLIAWAYLAGSLIFLCFRNRRLPLAVCTALMLGFWMAEFSGSFSDFKLPGFLFPLGESIASFIGTINSHVSLAGELGSQAAITVAGVLLATILWKPADETKQVAPVTPAGRTGFTLWFIAACCLGALLIHRPYLVWKNPATPSWCLWACASTALIWLVFYLVGDVWKIKFLTKPFAIAGQNVLMAYLFSEGAEALFNLLHISDWYDNLGSPTFAAAFSRSLGFGVFLLALTATLNRLGFRLRL